MFIDCLCSTIDGIALGKTKLDNKLINEVINEGDEFVVVHQSPLSRNSAILCKNAARTFNEEQLASRVLTAYWVSFKLIK